MQKGIHFLYHTTIPSEAAELLSLGRERALRRIPRPDQKCEFGPRQSLGVQLFFRGLYLFDTTLGKTVKPRELSRGSKFTLLVGAGYKHI